MQQFAVSERKVYNVGRNVHLFQQRLSKEVTYIYHRVRQDNTTDIVFGEGFFRLQCGNAFLKLYRIACA